MSRWGVWTTQDSCVLVCPQKDPNNSAGLTLTKDLAACRAHGRVGWRWRRLAVTSSFPSTLETRSPQGVIKWEEAFVEWTVMICGHLCQRMDSILPMGNVPRIHMADTVNELWVPSARFNFSSKQKQKEALGLTCCCSALVVFPYQLLPFLFPNTSPLLPTHHLLGQMSTADKVSFTKISRACSLPPQSGVSGCGTWWRCPRGQALSWEIRRDLYNPVALGDWLVSFHKACHSSLVPGKWTDNILW